MSTNEQINEAKFALEKGIMYIVYLFYLLILFHNDFF